MASILTGKFSGIWGAWNESLIISRMQDHMVVTSDGDYHMLVNLGTRGALTMFTSTDGGETWNYSFSLPDTNRQGTSDIQLMPDGETLIVTYLDGNEQIIYAEYDYDTDANSWSRLTASTVESGGVDSSAHPTVSISAQGYPVITYTEAVDGGLTLTLAVGGADGAWTVMEQAVPGATHGSARIVSTSDTDGIILTTDDSIHWLALENGQYVNEEILPIATPGHYGSHFSTTVYDNDVYLASPDDTGKLYFTVYDGQTHDWSEPRVLSVPGVYITSVQVSVSDEGNLYITVDDMNQSNLLYVLESKDGGKSWQVDQTLVTPTSIVDPPMRYEAPDYFTDNLVVAVQGREPGATWINGLYNFVIEKGSGLAPVPPEPEPPQPTPEPPGPPERGGYSYSGAPLDGSHQHSWSSSHADAGWL